jgi:nucleotide-binding universal stress UspA family protein
MLTNTGVQMFEMCPPKSVVVGIDGSQAAVRAARWAVDEVAGTETPLRLLYSRELTLGADRSAYHGLLAAAEDAVYDAYAAVEATGKSVKVEIDILEGCAIPVLIDATESTRLLCIGNAESGNACSNGFGSTAAKLVQSAHCSVAVVRGERHADLTDNRSIVALVDGTPDDDAAVEWGFEEATRRNAPLVLMTAYRTAFDLLQQDWILRDHDRRMRAALDHYVAARGPHYPAVHLRTVTALGTFLTYLADHAATTQLAIVGAHHTSEICQLVGPSGADAMHRSDFSLLVAR